MFNLIRVGVGKQELEREASEQEKRWNQLSTSQKVGDWASRHRYQLFLGGWAASMAASWILLRGNKTQSFSQKVSSSHLFLV